MNDVRSLGQKAADVAAAWIGSWTFIIVFNTLLMIWILFNLNMGKCAVDPFPFILLNLMLSWMAGIQAPLIMISQNRQEEIQKKTIEDIASIARATLEIAAAVRDQLEEHSEMLEDIHDIQLEVHNES